MRRTRKMFAAEAERNAILCPRCEGKGYTDDSIFGCYACRDNEASGHFTVAEWKTYKIDLVQRYSDSETLTDGKALAERVILRWEGGRRSTKAKRIEPGVRRWMKVKLIEMIVGDYRYYFEQLARLEADGVSAWQRGHVRAPVWTVTRAADNLAQWCNGPEDFYYATRRQQQSWTRSVLTSMVKAGLLETCWGLGQTRRETRNYMPTDETLERLEAEVKRS
jgi:hypothetical protein